MNFKDFMYVSKTTFASNSISMNFMFSVVLGIATCIISCAQQEGSTSKLSSNLTMSTNTDTATLGAGCFWCVEAVFQQLDGVLKVYSGYTGGHVANPTYEQVCEKNTGHVEVCQVVYDPEKISYDELLEVFWKTHDPTTPDQQGADVGPQYRSAIFYNSEEQRKTAEKYKAALQQSGAWSKPIVTTVEPLKTFYIAENYHQDYFNANPDQMYCRYVIQPKIEKFEKAFKDKLKKNKN
jgi:peptide-methionine (S)-S-oxide reductase